MEIIAIGIIVLVVLAFVFWVGYLIGAVNGLPEPQPNLGDLYCFECEIEMPVKEKDGRFYCSNCGLYHGAKI